MIPNLILIIIIFIILLLCYALFWQDKGDKLPRRNSRPAEKPPGDTLRQSVPTRALPPEMPTPDACPEDRETLRQAQGERMRERYRRDLPVPDFQADDPKDTFKANLLDNIEKIFPGEAEPPGNGSPPLAYGDVQKHIMDEVLIEVKALRNFRSDHRQLQKILNDPTMQIGSELSKMVTSDPVLAAKMLNTVNSPYYGLPQKVDSIGHALLLLGIVNIREILYRNGLLKLFRTEDPVQNEIVETLWKHATITSICASHLHSLYGGMDRGTLFTMGLLHDIGKLILLKWVGAEKYPVNLAISAEDAIFGINHAIVGRMALESWGFSDLMVSVIEQHHAPSSCEANDLDMDEQKKKYLMIIFFADQLAKLILSGEDAANIKSFLPSYLPMIDRQRFLDASVDNVLLSSIRQSEVFAE
jgi:putative nucleotidyltransferase with HDIG domain